MAKAGAAARNAALLWAEEGLAACQGMELILAGIGGLYVGIAIAEKLRVPFLQAYVVPFTPTAAFPGVLFPQSLSWLGGAFNHFSHFAVRQIMWQGLRAADTLARRQSPRFARVSAGRAASFRRASAAACTLRFQSLRRA